MNKIVRYLVPVLFGFLLMACGLAANITPTMISVSIPPAAVTPKAPRGARPSPTVSLSPTQAAAGSVEELTPCSLVTTAEVEAILGEPATAPNAVVGGCTFNNAKNSLYAVSVSAAQDQQTNDILQGQAMLLGFAGVQLDQTRMAKLKTLATALDFKGYFAELVAAAKGVEAAKVRLIDGGGNDVVYWAWLTVQSRRQGAFVAVRGPTLVNINVVVADSQSEKSMLAAYQSLADKIFARLPPKFTLTMPTAALTQAK
jgi:hypothetical protein